MARRPIPLESWEAVVPGVVFPLLALWLGGSTWGDRGLAAAANLAPLAALWVLAFVGGRRVPAVQGAATFAYALAAAGWIGDTWELPGFGLVGEHAALWTPVAAAGVAVVVFLLVALGLRLVAGPAEVAPTPGGGG